MRPVRGDNIMVETVGYGGGVVREALAAIDDTPYSVRVLERAAELQRRKAQDYQSRVSQVRQADYYPNGLTTILDIVHGKVLRVRSVVAKMDAGAEPNFESLEDSIVDAINYLSFAASYAAGQMDGQRQDVDILGRRVMPGTPGGMHARMVTRKDEVDQ
jgi:hypothetical protein